MSNIDYLLDDFDNSIFFTNNFKDYKFNHFSKKIFNLSNLSIKRINTYSNLNLTSNNISTLHNYLTDLEMHYDQNYGVNNYSSNFYDVDIAFKNAYIDLLKNEIRDLVGFDFFYQENPTLRIQLPHNSSKSFYPFYHSDIQLGHPPYEINIWFPLSPPSVKEGHGFVICDLQKSIDFFKNINFNFDYLKNNKSSIAQQLIDFSEIIDFDLGNILFFDSRCLHSTIPLVNHSRLSVDVRIMPKNIYKQFSHDYQGSGRKKVLFKPGDGYSLKSIDETEL